MIRWPYEIRIFKSSKTHFESTVKACKWVKISRDLCGTKPCPKVSVAPEPWGPRGHVPPPTHFAIVRGHGGTICSCTLGKTSNWRTNILPRNYPEFHLLTWQSACVHFIYFFFLTRLQRPQADFLRQHNHNITNTATALKLFYSFMLLFPFHFRQVSELVQSSVVKSNNKRMKRRLHDFFTIPRVS